MLFIVDDPVYRDLTAADLVALVPDGESLLFLADRTALTTPDLQVLAVSPSEEDEEVSESHKTLRVTAEALWSIENNIAVADMGWEEFVDAAGDDGVFRGF
jgi:hypothetical protein